MTTAPHSWAYETIAEHVHTYATLHGLLLQDDRLPGAEHKRLFDNVAQCNRDLHRKINGHGLREVVTTTHKATLLANGSVDVRRREDA